MDSDSEHEVINVDAASPSTDITPPPSEYPPEASRDAVSADSLLVKPLSDTTKEDEVDNLSTTSTDCEDEAECCTICLEPWTNSGDHRLSSLKCGHLFGHSCIVRWLKGPHGKCPQCNTKARKADIRIIYAKALRSLDTCERDRALEALEVERAARRQAELEAAEARLKCQLLTADCAALRASLQQQQQSYNSGLPPPLSQNATVIMQNSQAIAAKYILERNVTIWEIGGCRVMSHCAQMAVLCVSQPSASPLFPGFGIRKLSTLDMKTSQYIALHSKMVRDLSFNPDGLLLSASMDRSVAICNIRTANVVQRYECPAPVWACTWSLRNPSHFYAGLQNGTVCVYDIRQTAGHVQQLNLDRSRSPVVAVQALPRSTGYWSGGVLVGQLDRTTYFEEKTDDNYTIHPLPHHGNLTSLDVDVESKHILASYRPSAQNPQVQHQMSELAMESDNMAPSSQHKTFTTKLVRSFSGGNTQKLLSRSRFIRGPLEGGKLLVCAADETALAVQTWDPCTGRLLQKMSSPSAVIDLCPLRINESHLLIALTDKQILIHKWR